MIATIADIQDAETREKAIEYATESFNRSGLTIGRKTVRRVHIAGAFVWEDTPEGAQFWQDLEAELEQHLASTKENH